MAKDRFGFGTEVDARRTELNDIQGFINNSYDEQGMEQIFLNALTLKMKVLVKLIL